MTLDLQVLWADLGDSHRCTHGLGLPIFCRSVAIAIVIPINGCEWQILVGHGNAMPLPAIDLPGC
jgi:hypothetical protein